MRTFSVYTEYRQLKEVLVCRPTHYFQSRPINNVEAHYFKNDPPVRENLLQEHRVWTDLLEQLGVQCVYLEEKEGLPHQLFTRDVGFAVGGDFFLAKMAKEIRKKEVEVLQEWLKKEEVPFKIFPSGTVEGGDVLVHAPYVFVGLSQRTNKTGIGHLAKFLGKNWKVVPILLEASVLHLDCVLAILNEETIVWCPDLIVGQHEWLKKTFRNRVAISAEESFHMAANLLTINPDHVLVEAKQFRLQTELQKMGIKIHPIPWSEIKKLGGLFRCASCPIA